MKSCKYHRITGLRSQQHLVQARLATPDLGVRFPPWMTSSALENSFFRHKADMTLLFEVEIDLSLYGCAYPSR